jgi:hypothetical protein
MVDSSGISLAASTKRSISEETKHWNSGMPGTEKPHCLPRLAKTKKTLKRRQITKA